MSQKLPPKKEIEDQKRKQDGPPWESFVPVTCVVEKAGVISKDDSYFFTELRVLTGTLRGELVKQNWSRQWKSGDWRIDTIDFLRTLCPKEDEDGSPVWSYMLVDKCFAMTPSQNKKGFWTYSDFSLQKVPDEDRGYDGSSSDPF